MKKLTKNIVSLVGSAGLLLSAGSLLAGTKTWDFTTDPTSDPTLEFFGNNEYPWLETTGNPGGFLKLTYSIGSQNKWVVFPDIDEGKIVTAFEFSCDLRVGNPQSDRAADGFSISFARSSDRLLVDAGTMGDINNFALAGCPENGTQTGIAIGFDTWSGNTLPDGADIEGIIVRVDNVTVLKHAMPTRNGSADDATSMQTGPRDAAYWSDPGYSADPTTWAMDPKAWAGLAWRPLTVKLDETGKLTVNWKGATILDNYQTAYFPSAGRLVLACRTGGSNENTDFDNITLTTTAQTVDSQKPTNPANGKADVQGAYRVLLVWDPSTDDSGRVAYEVEQDGTILTATYPEAKADIRGLTPNTTYAFRVRATDVSGNKSDWISVQAKTVSDVDDSNYALIKIYGTADSAISGTQVDALLADGRYPDSPDRTARLNGMVMSFGEPGFGETFGDNNGYRIAGTITPAESGQYHFFVRSDDASQLYLNTTSATIPVADGVSQIAEEYDCCDAFVEPGTMNDDATTSATTSSPITLQAGKEYGILYVVKEGTGGDWGQVAWRKVGDTTAAGNLPALGFPYFKSEAVPKADPVGAVVTIDEAPQSATVFANEPVKFTAKVTATSPYTTSPIYQWFRDGKAIPGATAFTYSIPVTAVNDNGAKFSFMAAVPGASVTSTEAVLTVQPDTKLPTMVSVNAWDTLDALVIRFSEPMTAASATAAANYKIDNGVTVSAAKAIDQYTVQLTTSAQAPGTIYTLTVNDVTDSAGNKIAANSAFKFHSFTMVLGKARVLFYNNIGGTAVSALTGDARFPYVPSDARLMTNLTSPDSYGDNYGSMVRGFIEPKESASYDFFIYSDDASAIYLNTTGELSPNPLTATPIAQETDCCDVFADPGTMNDDGTTSTTTTTPIALEAGKRYGFTVLLKEGGGGDMVQVAWRKSTDATPVGSLTPIPAEFLGCYAPAAATNILSTNDIIVASSTNSPSSGNENAANVLDGNSATKYLNFDKLNTGFTVTPKAGATVITGLALTSANDAPERDPASYLVEGSNDGVTFTTIAQGNVPKFSARFTTQSFTFGNSTPYLIYKVTFPTVYTASAANSMQIADVALLGNIYGGVIPSGEQPEFTDIAKNADGSFTISWSGGGTLEAGTSVTGPFQPVPGATSPYTFTPTEAVMFGRIRK